MAWPQKPLAGWYLINGIEANVSLRSAWKSYLRSNRDIHIRHPVLIALSMLALLFLVGLLPWPHMRLPQALLLTIPVAVIIAGMWLLFLAWLFRNEVREPDP